MALCGLNSSGLCLPFIQVRNGERAPSLTQLTSFFRPLCPLLPRPQTIFSVVTNSCFLKTPTSLFLVLCWLNFLKALGRSDLSGNLAHQLILLVPPLLLQLTQKKKPKLGKPSAIEIPQRSLQRELRELNTVRSFASLPKQKQPPRKNKLPNQKTKRKNLHTNFSPYRI